MIKVIRNKLRRSFALFSKEKLIWKIELEVKKAEVLMKQKIINKLKETASFILSRFTSIINQLPDPHEKVRHSPIFHHPQLVHAVAKRPPIDRSPVHNHSRDRKRKGPRHSSTMIYNHPRG